MVHTYRVHTNPANEQRSVVSKKILLAVALLTGIMVLLSWIAGWACSLGASDRFRLSMVYVVRNVVIATTLGGTSLGWLEFTVFATACFLDLVLVQVLALCLF